MSSAMKAIAICAVLLFVPLGLMMLWGIVQRSASMGREVEYSYSDLYEKVQNGQVQDATVEGNELRGHLKASPKDEFHVTLPANYQELQKAMLDPSHKVTFTVKPARSNFLLPLLINVGPFVIVIMASAVLVIAPFWVIFKKAGFEPALSVLMMVPFVNFVLLYIVAFSEWKPAPAQKP
jgi:ATP-dependent Zn protease